MKTNLTFLLIGCYFLLCPFTGFGQNSVEYIFSELEKTRINAHLPVGNEVYSVGAVYACGAPILNKSTPEKTETWMGPDGIWEFSDLILWPGTDSLLITCGYFDFDDVGPLDENVPHVLAYDLDGTLVFDTPLPLEENAIIDKAMKVSINGAEQLVAKFGNTLYWVNREGLFQSSATYSETEFIAIEYLNDQTMLALGNEILYWMTNEGVITDSLSFDIGTKSIWVGHGSIYVLTHEALMVIATPTQVESYTFFNAELVPRGIRGNDEFLFFWGADFVTQFNKIIQVEVPGFNIVGKVLFEQEITQITDLQIGGEDIVLSGYQASAFNTLSFGFVKTMELLSPPVFKGGDIALNDFRVLNGLEVDSMEIEIHPDSTLVLYSLRAFPMIFELEVSNEGLDTLKSFSFYSNSYAAINCLEARIFIHYQDLAIPPGESVIIQDSVPIVFQSTPTIQKTLELGVMAPNHHFDTDIINNRLEVNLTVGLKRPLLGSDLSISLQPNPAKDFILLKKEGTGHWKEASVLVFDVQGKKTLEQHPINLAGGESFFLDTSSLPPGLYLMNVLADRKVYPKKFVIH